MKPRPGAETSIARRNSFALKKTFTSKTDFNALDSEKDTSGIEITTPCNRIQRKNLQVNRKNKRSVTGNVSPVSDGSPMEDQKKSEKFLQECNKFVFRFGKEPDSLMSKSETQNHKLVDMSGSVISAKESLYDLRHEAKLYLTTNKRIISDAQKSIKASFVSEDFRGSFVQSEVFQDPLKDLSDSISSLKTKLEDNEKKQAEHLSSEISLQDTLKSLEKNLEKYKNLKRKNENKNAGCTNNCQVI